MDADAPPAPRRVLMTADTLGGVWTYALELAAALQPWGVEVALATMGARTTDSQRAEAGRIANLCLFESHFRLEWMDDPWDDVERAGDWLLGLADRLDPDLIHLNGYAHCSMDSGRPTLVVGHSCVLSWWRAVRGEEAPANWDRYRAEVSRGIQAADAVVAPTRAMLDSLGGDYGPLPWSVVVPNGRSSAQFRPDRSKEPILLAAGRLWDEAKNVSALERIATRLAWPVFVAGDASHPGGGAFEARGLRLLGRLAPDELASWYGRASIYVLPARYEPFGLSALEAALAGCALVLGDIPSLREVWGEAALYVAPDDPEGLLAGLDGLIADRTRREDLARKAHHVARGYAPRRMASGYVAAYRRIMCPDSVEAVAP